MSQHAKRKVTRTRRAEEPESTSAVQEVDVEMVLQPGFWTVERAARETGMHPASIRKLAHMGEIVGLRPLPRFLVVTEKSVADYEGQLTNRGRPRGVPAK